MPAIDDFANNSSSVLGPLVGAFLITPHATEELPKVTRQIYVGGAGNIQVVWADGTETIEPVADGDRLDWRIRQVKAASTTATGLRGYY